MKKLLLLTFILSTFLSKAQLYIPTDLYNEPAGKSYKFLPNDGQLENTDGNLATNILYYHDRHVPRTYYGDNDIYFVAPGMVTDSVGESDSLFRIRLRFVGGEHEILNCVPIVSEQDNVSHNFYLAHTGSGVEGVKGNGRVVYEDIYDDIDFHAYSNKNGLKTYTVIKPGGDPNDIHMQFSGQTAINTATNGALDVYINQYNFEFPELIAYEVDNNGTATLLNWNPVYVQQGNGVVSLTTGSYDITKTLVLMAGIPTALSPAAPPFIENLLWCTNLPSVDAEFGTKVVTDNGGNVFLGLTATDFKFPTAAVKNGVVSTKNAAILGFKNNHEDWFVTYIGTDDDDYNVRIAVDNNNHVFMGAVAAGVDLYTTGPTGSYLDNSPDAPYNDWMVAKIDYGNDGVIEWSTYIDSENQVDRFMAVGVDNNGAVFFAGQGGSNMPLKSLAGAYNSSTGDAIILKFSNAGVLQWGTRFGGTAAVGIEAIKFDSQNRMVLTGVAADNTFTDEDAGSGAYTANFAGGYFDGFFTIFNANLSLFHSTRIGGTDVDHLYGLDIDDQDNIYMSGAALGAGWPNENLGGGAYLDNTHNGNGTYSLITGDGILLKVNKDGVLKHSTYYGGRADENGLGLAVTPDGYVLMVGTTTSDDFPTQSINDAYQENRHSRGNDIIENGFVTMFDDNLNQKWSSYFASSDAMAAVGTAHSFAYTWDADVANNGHLFTVGVFGSAQRKKHTFPFVEDPNGYFDDASSEQGGMFVADYDVRNPLPPATIFEKKAAFSLLQVFPNPAKNQITIGLKNEAVFNGEIVIKNLQGQVLFRTNEQEVTELKIDINKYSTGSYIVQYGNQSTLFIKQ